MGWLAVRTARGAPCDFHDFKNKGLDPDLMEIAIKLSVILIVLILSITYSTHSLSHSRSFYDDYKWDIITIGNL